MKKLRKFYFKLLFLFSHNVMASVTQVTIQDNELIIDKDIISNRPYAQQYNMSYSMFINNNKTLLCSPDYGANPLIPLKIRTRENDNKVTEKVIVLCSWFVKLPAEQINAIAYELNVFNAKNGLKFNLKNKLSCRNLFFGFDGVVNGKESHYVLASNAALSERKLNDIEQCITSDEKRAIVKKSYLYSEPQTAKKTNMYLIKGDKVNVLQRQADFYEINYHSKKKGIITKWLHCSAIDGCVKQK